MTRNRVPRPIVVTAFLILMALVTSGCFFDTRLDISVHDDGEGEVLAVFITTNAGTDICSPVEEGEGSRSFECTFFAGEGGAISTFTIESLPEFLALLVLIDPLVVQFPANAADFAGSFVNNDTGESGNLSIASGLAEVSVDDTRSLVAEPGTQLVTIELPPDAPTPGDYTFDLRFNVPRGTTEVVAKPLFAGRIELNDGRVFYAPLLPCTTDLGQVPELTISIPPGGGHADVVFRPPSSNLACDGEVYQYVEGAPPPTGEVLIDILPGSDRNPINPERGGVIPVAVLTTADFDATTVDPATVTFGPNGAPEMHGQGHVEDVDGDGDGDLILHFRTRDTGISCSDTDATLTASTVDGQGITGTDTIDTVACE